MYTQKHIKKRIDFLLSLTDKMNALLYSYKTVTPAERTEIYEAGRRAQYLLNQISKTYKPQTNPGRFYNFSENITPEQASGNGRYSLD